MPRTEDQRFLTGSGNYTDDTTLPHQTHAAFVRSTHPHASFTLDASAAARRARGPGRPDRCGSRGGRARHAHLRLAGHRKDGEPHKAPPHPVLAVDTVRHVGDAIAVVVAESARAARDAAEQVEVSYAPLPAVVSMQDALADGAPQIHADAPGNLCYDWEIGDRAATDDAFARAHHVARLDLVNNRLIPNAMEPRSAIGDFNPATGDYSLRLTSQNPHIHRLVLAAFIQIAPEHKLHVIAPDVGGGFGSKIFIYQEETAVLWAAGKVGRPVKWTADRSESFVADAHGRDHETHVELALDADGPGPRPQGLDPRQHGRLSLDLRELRALVPVRHPAPGPVHHRGHLLRGQGGVHQHDPGGRAPRGGSPGGDLRGGADRRPGGARDGNRRRGAQAPQLHSRRRLPLPHQGRARIRTPGTTGSPSTARSSSRAMGGSPPGAKRRGQGASFAGIGLSAYIEACGIAPSQVVGSLGAGVGLWESGGIRFNPTGNVLVYTGSHSHGQGHETTFAQLVSDYLGVPFENIEVVHGDTEKTPFGMGTYGSRSLAVGGSALVKAMDKVIAKGRKIAAFTLEASEEDIEFSGGNFSVAGTDRSMNIAEVAFSAYVPHNYPLDELEPGLEETGFYDPANFTFPGRHSRVRSGGGPGDRSHRDRELDRRRRLRQRRQPDDRRGQVHGGVAHGVGQALLEGCAYDADGQLLTGSFMDYTMPRADDLPDMTVETTCTPCPHNPLGVKGCGEAGAIAAPAAVMNAITDALGTSAIDMPATPQAVWRALSG